MKNMLKKLSPYRFLIFLVLFFLLFDYAAMCYGESHWTVATNDYEVTKRDHPEKVWDKVFFGNSDIISSYREDLSESGYINLGMDYGVVTDLWELIDQGHITIGSDLVIGMNMFLLYDDFDTNPSYIWHREAWEPYTYFHRGKMKTYLENAVKTVLHKGTIGTGVAGKIYYYGTMSDADILAKEVSFEERFYNLPLDAFDENIEALDKIADWCDEHDVRLRILWTPVNPLAEDQELILQLTDIVNEWCQERGIESVDYTDSFPKECFYDGTHMNYEYGAYIFTEEVDKWLSE